MRVLFVENDDSFSWNVVDLLPCSRGELVLASPAEAGDRLRALGPGSLVVIGPGPKDPLRTGLVEVVQEAARLGLPLLGICLGFQALGLAFGARLVRTAPVHGKHSCITFRPSRLFPGIEGEHPAMRYHSLALDSIGAPLRLVAQTVDGIPMALEHERLPMAGLQFHPDSYATPSGRAMVESFFGAVR